MRSSAVSSSWRCSAAALAASPFSFSHSRACAASEVSRSQVLVPEPPEPAVEAFSCSSACRMRIFEFSRRLATTLSRLGLWLPLHSWRKRSPSRPFQGADWIWLCRVPARLLNRDAAWSAALARARNWLMSAP